VPFFKAWTLGVKPNVLNSMRPTDFFLYFEFLEILSYSTDEKLSKKIDLIIIIMVK